MPNLRDLDLDIHYEATGESILASLVQPALAASIKYDRLTGYFSIASLLAISEGIDGLWRRRGKMRLVLGAHDVPRELLDAAAADLWPEAAIEALQQRLLHGVSTLTDELARDKVATIAWMMKEGLLAVRVAAPARADQATGTSIFHNKRLIFADSHGDAVTAVGSPNETYGGLVANFEELTVHMSWADPQGYVQAHQESFERIWAGLRDDLIVRELSAEFADELLQAASRPSLPPGREPRSVYLDFLNVTRQLPGLGFLNLTTAALYPHQERAVVDGLDRWPIRALLADEVGLGKTLEAGAILAHLLRSKAVRRVMILAPKNVMRQWRDEMYQHFQLDFAVYNSGARQFEFADGRVLRAPSGHPLGSGAPNWLIVSTQLARGTSQSEDLLAGATLPDLLLVDEAHAARVRTDLDGSKRPTLLWKLLDRHRASIPHLLLLTATPVQLEWSEYFALLRLLGLPRDWDEPTYERSLQLLATTSMPTLDEAGEAISLIVSATHGYETEAATPLLEDRINLAAGALERALTAQREWPSVFEALVASHPANVLTVRNSRSALERLGYSFPDRVFFAPALLVPSEVKSFYDSVSIYLRDAYGMTEQAAAPDRGVQLGFVKSTYFQRLASSLEAARRTLLRRLAKLESATDRLDVTDPGEPDDDAESELVVPNPREGMQDAVRRAAAVERAFVLDLLGQLDSISNKDIEDPKLAQVVADVRARVLAGDRVLVFSRYTDTVDACLTAFLEAPGGEAIGHAMYTGGTSWVDSGGGPVPATKEGVRRALEKGLVSVVFCSDAASEGLNLQAARVLINVDVPWNPARLEQRIGRIARLGQCADRVDVINLWYPESVEARMYGRLLARRDLYELAVGSLPEIVSEAIRQEVATSFEGSAALGADPLQRLQDVREDIQLRAISKVWDQMGLLDSSSSAQREKMIALIRGYCLRARVPIDEVEDGLIVASGGRYFELQATPGSSSPISLLHEIWDKLAPVAASGTDSVVCVEVDGLPIGIGLRTAAGYALIPDEKTVDVLATLLGEGPYRVPKDTEWLDADAFVAAVTGARGRNPTAMPGHGKWRIPVELDVNPPDPGAPRVRNIGSLPTTVQP